ncbi:MAG: oligoendopeptidase F [Anaerolineales bacterium]
MAKITLPPRQEVPLEETWHLESIFSSVEEWKKAYQEVKQKLPDIRAFQGELDQGPDQVARCFHLMEELLQESGKVVTYALLESSVDISDQEAAGRAGQARSLFSESLAAVSFIQPELVSIGFETLEGWMEEEPQLSQYEHYLDNLERLSDHIRSVEVENILALTTDPLPKSTPPQAYTALVNADLEFEPARTEDGRELEIGQSSIRSLKSDEDREVRRTAWEHYADGYLAFQNTLAGLQTAAFKRDAFHARVRKYPSSLEASLFENNIPVEVFQNLIRVFKDNLPTWHRYWNLKRKAHGYNKLHVYDIKAPLTSEKPEIPYQQAVDWICEGMAPLGEEYVSALRAGCEEERWVDRAKNRGKRQGAFSSGTYGTKPFIMMSYDDDIFSLSTLTHELGHSLHKYYTHRNQPFIYGRYSLFVAEVASNFNQALVRDHLFRTQKDPNFQLALIEEAMSNFHRYFFVMPTLARFEQEMHRRVEEGEAVNARSMIHLMADLFKEGYGDAVVFDQDRIGITWAQFQHLYMNFYVYQYATGISGAHALADQVLSGEPQAAEEYLGFLSAGSSVYPLEALNSAGVDLTEPQPVEKAFQVLAEIVDRLESLVERGEV